MNLFPAESSNADFGPAQMKPRRRYPLGFSLVEVVMALSIVAGCCIVMVGLLGVGLTTFNTSQELTISGKIDEQIVSDIEQAGWSGVLQQYFGIPNATASTTWVGTSATPQTSLYDEYGNLLTGTSSTASPIYQATVTPLTTAGGPASPENGNAGSPSLIQFQIQISRVGVPNPATAPGTTTYTAFVAHD